MLISIPKNRIRKGMYIESVACPSREFSKRRFLLSNEDDLRAIALSSADVVLINVSRGVDQDGRTVRIEPQKLGLDMSFEAKARQIRDSIGAQTVAAKASLEEIAGGTTPDMTSLEPMADVVDRAWSDEPLVALELTRLKTKDETTYEHSLAVSGLMALMGRALRLDEKTVREMGIAGILHDIGKLHIPDDILTKPANLTSREREIIRNHPEAGYQILKAYPNMSPIILDICRLHHEALDGSGYPLGLKAPKLPLHVRIATVCDVFEALTSIRPYKRPWSTEQAIKWMFERPQFFDAKLVIRLGSILTPGGRIS
ncbi:HD domain-containing protein [Peteryoungia desertarenae]|uniref:HD domain-containing protein n=1 Tax=Peteryoungia desertarenae TaxID=1813451 RepID=A0ABX6QNF7_9HYPH|nr:HD-GYP domain-containing protein [Peteryoungia desertarenae]QLF69826.1 HD domain-containing protein [Peteryoungia desertarenae]